MDSQPPREVFRAEALRHRYQTRPARAIALRLPSLRLVLGLWGALGATVAGTLVVVAHWPSYLDVTLDVVGVAPADSGETLRLEFDGRRAAGVALVPGVRAALFLPDVARSLNVVVVERPAEVGSPDAPGLRSYLDSLPGGIAPARGNARRLVMMRTAVGERVTPGFSGHALLRLEGR